MTPSGSCRLNDFVKTAGLFDAFVADCPLRYVSPNEPKRRDVLGTAMLSMLAGHHARAYRGAALRRRAARASGDEEDRQRGRGPARLQGDRRAGRSRLAAPTPAIFRGAAAAGPGFSMSIRRSSRSTVVRKGPSGLQSQEAGASKPLLSPIFDGFSASRSRCKRQSRRRAYVQTQRAEPVGVGGSSAARPGPAHLRGDRGFGNEEIMREAEARALPFLLKLRLAEHQAHDRESPRRANGSTPARASRRRRARFGWWAGAVNGA